MPYKHEPWKIKSRGAFAPPLMPSAWYSWQPAALLQHLHPQQTEADFIRVG